MNSDESFIASKKALKLQGDKLSKTWMSSKYIKKNFQNYISFLSSDSITWRRRFARIAGGAEGCELRTMKQLLNTAQRRQV